MTVVRLTMVVRLTIMFQTHTIFRPSGTLEHSIKPQVNPPHFHQTTHQFSLASTQSLKVKMRFNQILTVSFIYLATGAFAQQCNQGGGFFSCSDAQTACNSVTTGTIKLGNQETARQIGGFGSAQVWLTRAKTSATNGNMHDLCVDIFNSCCAGQSFAQKSTIALQNGEQGSVQIIPS